MTQNKQMIERYMDGFRRGDHEQILGCLTDDVEWELPGAFHARGKHAFEDHIEEEFIGRPAITVTDVLEMLGGKIRRLISYLMHTA